MTANRPRRLGSALTRVGSCLVVALALGACGAGGEATKTDAATTQAASSTGATSSASRSAGSTSSTASSGTSSPSSGSSSTAGADGSTDGHGAGTGSGPLYDVVSVVDGDTIKVRIDGKKETLRLIGLDTPETKKPRTPVQCYGKEASSHMQSLVQSKQVQLEADPTQGERDKYGRLLRYVFVGGSTNVALAQIQGGFGREDTYDAAYAYQAQFQSAQVAAQHAKRGTWGPPCNGFHRDDAASSESPSNPNNSASSTPGTTAAQPGAAQQPSGSCTIKGNINAKGEKIAHLPGSRSYAKTKITPSKGERMFCSSADAIAAGWRIAAD